ncbi:unnamed protein product [Camellia sinensis]
MTRATTVRGRGCGNPTIRKKVPTLVGTSTREEFEVGSGGLLELGEEGLLELEDLHLEGLHLEGLQLVVLHLKFQHNLV